MSYKNPTEHTITSPKFLDKKVQEIQTAIGEISWVTKSFGRAFKGTKDEGVKYPEVYQAFGKDYHNVFPNDNVACFSFIYVKQPQSNVASGYEKYFLDFKCDISIIIFFNLNKIDTALQYRFTELLKEDILNKLFDIKRCTVNQTYDEIEECYSDFTFTAIDSKYLDRKYGALRFDCTIEYANECKINNVYTI